MKEENKKTTAKRKDSHGRVLRTGETQRKKGNYEYRYTDDAGKRHSLYANTLEELRGKEQELQACRALGHGEETSVQEVRKKEAELLVCTALGIDPNQPDMTTEELVQEYVDLKRNVRYATRRGYGFVQSVLVKYAIAKQPIRSIKVTDAKRWIIQLYDDGYAWNSIASIRGVLRPAFQMAFNEERIRRNPFDFRLDFIPNDGQKRVALSQQQQKRFLEFIRNDDQYAKYLDEIVVLLGTGMRVSEFCGLTMADLDFENRRIRVDHQLVWTNTCKRYVEKTKTESGCRMIPMSDEVYLALYNILAGRPRPKREVMVDGYTGFLLLDQNGNPKVALHIEHVVTRIWEKYNRENVIPLPKITPHVFRHTFCTNMANAGMDLKSLQYLMGHSDVSVTLNVYTHTSYEKAEEEMAKVVKFSQDPLPQNLKRRKA